MPEEPRKPVWFPVKPLPGPRNLPETPSSGKVKIPEPPPPLIERRDDEIGSDEALHVILPWPPSVFAVFRDPLRRRRPSTVGEAYLAACAGVIRPVLREFVGQIGVSVRLAPPRATGATARRLDAHSDTVLYVLHAISVIDRHALRAFEARFVEPDGLGWARVGVRICP